LRFEIVLEFENYLHGKLENLKFEVLCPKLDLETYPSEGLTSLAAQNTTNVTADRTAFA
jgi:hypothetical protein